MAAIQATLHKNDVDNTVDEVHKNDVDSTVDEETKNALKALGDRGYFCDICKTSCRYDEDKIKQHNEGSKHKKNMAAQLKLHELKQKHDCIKQELETGKLRCMICGLLVITPWLLEGHFNGKLHKKMAMSAHENSNAHSDIKQAEAVEPGMTLGLEVTAEPGTDAVTAAAGSAEAAAAAAGSAAVAAKITSNKSIEESGPSYWCKICKMHGNVPAPIKKAHMDGIKHKKKETGYYLLQKLKQQEDCIAENPVSGLLKCTVCIIEIDTPQQLATHLSGAKHKSKAKSVALAPETADMEEGEVAPEVYWCEVCKLSGPATDTAVAQHKLGAKHLKKVAQKELLEKLLITEDCFDYNETTGMLKCNICNIEHNTPQLLEMHLESDKHKARIDGRPIDEKPFKRKYYKDYDDPYQTEAKRMTLNPRDRKCYKNHRGITPDKIRNLSAPHVEIKDLGMLMNKWSSAYYRNNS